MGDFQRGYPCRERERERERETRQGCPLTASCFTGAPGSTTTTTTSTQLQCPSDPVETRRRAYHSTALTDVWKVNVKQHTQDTQAGWENLPHKVHHLNHFFHFE